MVSRPAYAEALAQYMKANDISADEFLSGSLRNDVKQRAQEFAILEAQQATYRDINAFSELVSGFGKARNSKNKAAKVGSYLIEGVLPFKKSPRILQLER